MAGCWEALAAKDMIVFVDHGGDMEILMRVDATDHATSSYTLFDCHCGFPGSTLLNGFVATECLDRTVT
jgi:hypothetical protein